MHFADKTPLMAAMLLALVALVTGCEENGGKSNANGSATVSGLIPDTPPLGEPIGSSDVSDLPEDDDFPAAGAGGAEGGGGADAAPAGSGSASKTDPPAPASKKKKKRKNRKKKKIKPTAAKPAPVVLPPPAPATAKKLDPAKPGSADEVAANIDKIYGPVKLFRARFNQSYTAKIHGTKKKSKGILYVKKPGKLSLSYHDPNKNRAVSDGSTLKVYEHDNKQMFVKNVKNTEYPGAFSFILGEGLRQSFTFKFHKTSKWEGGPVLVGTPKTPNPGYKKVLFYIDKERLDKGELGCIRRVLVIDAQGNRNRFDFVHAEEPKSIPDKWFDFKPPKGTEIIKS